MPWPVRWQIEIIFPATNFVQIIPAVGSENIQQLFPIKIVLIPLHQPNTADEYYLHSYIFQKTEPPKDSHNIPARKLVQTWIWPWAISKLIVGRFNRLKRP